MVNIVNHFKRFNSHGNGLIIKGRVRVGKTYLASLLIKNLLFSGFAVISNIRFTNDVYQEYKDRLFYIKNDRQFFESYLKIPIDTPIVLAWDDIQASEGFKSTHVTRKSGDLLSQFLIFIGKLDTNYIYIAHQKYIPDCILDGFEPLIIYKFEKNSYWVTTELLEKDKEVFKISPKKKIHVIQPKNFKPLPTLSKAIATFNFTLDLPDLYESLSTFDIGEDLRKGVKKYLDENIFDSDNLKYHRLKKLSYSDIYLALCLKRDKILSDGLTLRELINSNQIQPVRKELRKKGFKDT